MLATFFLPYFTFRDQCYLAYIILEANTIPFLALVEHVMNMKVLLCAFHDYHFLSNLG